MRDILNLGTATDMLERTNKRLPSPRLFRMVEKARKAIFNGFKVSGTRVERLIGGKSRIAVRVRGAPLLNVWSHIGPNAL